MRVMGYAVFQEVDLSTFSYQPKYARKQITDFDVLGVFIEPDFYVSVAVAECKSAQDRAMESLLKLNGLKEFFRARKAYFVQSRIDINAREVARQLGIWALDEQNLSTLLAGVGVQESPHVEMERLVYDSKSRLVKDQKAVFPKVVDYLKYDFWTLPEHRNIVNLIRHAQLISTKLQPSRLSHILLAHQVATNFALSTIQLTSQIARHNISDVETGSLNMIFGSVRERRDREALFDTVNKLIPGAGLTFLPEFMPGLRELIARFINASAAASKVVMCLDHMTRTLVVPKVESILGTPEDIFGSRTLKLSRDVLHFLVSVGNFPRSVFASSFSESTAQPRKITPEEKPSSDANRLGSQQRELKEGAIKSN
jgi:hypothetical protein